MGLVVCIMGRNEVICPCGQHFFAWRSSIKRGGGKFCSKEIGRAHV